MLFGLRLPFLTAAVSATVLYVALALLYCTGRKAYVTKHLLAFYLYLVWWTIPGMYNCMYGCTTVCIRVLLGVCAYDTSMGPYCMNE